MVETNSSRKADCYELWLELIPPLCFAENEHAKKEATYGTIYMWVTARTRWKHSVGPSSVELRLAYTYQDPRDDSADRGGKTGKVDEDRTSSAAL
jgi:hypothetical protein